MPSPIKYTLVFNSGQYIWTEAYLSNIAQTAVDSPQAKGLANRLATNRSFLLGVGAKIAAVRISVPGVRRDTFPFRNPNTTDGSWTGPSGLFTSSAADANVDFADTSLFVRYEFAGNNFADRWLGGCPDRVQTGPNSYDLSKFDGGLASWNKWYNYITGGNWGSMQVVSYKTGIQLPVTAVANDGVGHLLLTTAAAYAVGTKFKLANTTFTMGDKINGTYTVAARAGGVITTKERKALLPATVFNGIGNVYQYTYEFGEFQDLNVQSVGERKRGNRGPFSPHGKQKTHS